jgi:hypothetical protein
VDSSAEHDWVNLSSTDGATRSAALTALLTATEQPVAWSYAVWDALVARLHHPDNHQRAIAAQLLCRLAASDPEQRILRDLDALIALTRDPRFVTARHTLQALWRIGLAGEPQRRQVVARLAERFHDCTSEKNATLIRADIVAGLRQLDDRVPDEHVRETALALIAHETDPTYRAKYAALWRSRSTRAR